MQLPDTKHLLHTLAEKICPHVNADTGIVGVHTGGAWVAQWLQKELKVDKPIGSLDISFYRDDFQRVGLHPQVRPSDIPFDVEGCDIILVDDVLYTGRTIRAAMNELFDYGRPRRIRLAVLVDRGGRELPVSAQFAACNLALTDKQNIQLEQDSSGALILKLKEIG